MSLNNSYLSRTFRNLAVTAVKAGRRSYEAISRRSVMQCDPVVAPQIVEIDGYGSTFAGYYDVSPFRPGRKEIAVHATNWPINRTPDPRASVDLFLYDLETGASRYLDSTTCWNWQQGARLQWINKDTVVFNQLVDHEIRGISLDVETNRSEILPESLSIAYQDKYFLSIDYGELFRCSEYGYAAAAELPRSDVVKCCTFRQREVRPLFHWRELSFLNDIGFHREHINHLLPAPSGTRLVFIYRYWIKQQRYDSLILFDFRTNSHRVLAANLVVSHYTWRNENELLVWGSFDRQAGYFILDVETGELKMTNPLTDGHPNFIGQDLYIADIGNSFRRLPLLSLYVFDLRSFERRDLLVLSHPTLFNPACRCDMHPSLSPDRAFFQVDSRHLPGRRVVVVGSIPAQQSVGR